VLLGLFPHISELLVDLGVLRSQFLNDLPVLLNFLLQRRILLLLKK
jgi:hypothetical protein